VSVALERPAGGVEALYQLARANGYGAATALRMARASEAPRLRVRWEPEDLPIADTFDPSVTDLEKLGRDIDAGRLVYLCAIVDRQCDTCGHWEVIDSLGAVCAPPGDPHLILTELELLAEHAEVE
jgi:hypothetical protein